MTVEEKVSELNNFAQHSGEFSEVLMDQDEPSLLAEENQREKS